MENKVASNALAPTRVRLKTNKCTKNKRWTKEEDELLFSLVKKSDSINWHQIASNFPNKTTQQVTERWEKVLDPELVKGSWTRDEDQTIINFVRENGCKNWTRLSSLLPGRIGKQCRERWRNHLDPNIKHTTWTDDEDILLFKLHNQYGNRWVKISSMMPGRSDNSIKNRWNSTLKKISSPELKNISTPILLQNKSYQPNQMEMPHVVLDETKDNSHQLSVVNPTPVQTNGPIPMVQNTEVTMPMVNPASNLFTPFKIEPNSIAKPDVQHIGSTELEISKLSVPEAATETSPRPFQNASSVENNGQKPFVLLKEERANDGN
ncbi:hypothetical protein M9Y10_041478 [Tritrichomonas musculus]|uniref:Myb-like DNA-binding domain containing protein n=1 Tax=Tritrichomonas musculus TaxID=1915356 RepID=A0ABR2K4G1_9EUKA